MLGAIIEIAKFNAGATDVSLQKAEKVLVECFQNTLENYIILATDYLM